MIRPYPSGNSYVRRSCVVEPSSSIVEGQFQRPVLDNLAAWREAEVIETHHEYYNDNPDDEHGSLTLPCSRSRMPSLGLLRQGFLPNIRTWSPGCFKSI